MLSLENKTAVITGGDSGIGMHAAMLLVSEGATMVLSGMEKNKLEQTRGNSTTTASSQDPYHSLQHPSENDDQPMRKKVHTIPAKRGLLIFPNVYRTLTPKKVYHSIVFSPACIETPMTDAMMDQLSKYNGASKGEGIMLPKNERPHIAVGRRGKRDEVAAVIAFLVSQQAGYVNGSN